MRPTTRSEWERIPADPDPERDLGYARSTLSVIRTENGTGHYLFLPEDDDRLRGEAFIVAEEEAVHDLTAII